MFKRKKIKIKIEFNIETEELKIVFKPKETRPSKVMTILSNAQQLLDEILQEINAEEQKEGKEPTYIS